MKLTYGEVMERVKWLEQDQNLKALQERARTAWIPLFDMTHSPQIPEHLTRQITFSAPSPRIADLTEALIADVAAFRAITTVAAFGKDGPPTADQKKGADKIERFASTLQAEWNDDGKLDAEAMHQLLAGPYFVAILQVGDPTSNNPWAVLMPDPLSCYFPVQGTPFRPEMMARRYRQLVRKTEAAYSEQKRGSYAGQRLRKRARWQWEPIGQDVAADEGQSNAYGGDPKYGEEHEMIWFADKEYIYHIAQDDGDSGEIVYCEENLTGGCPALVISGAPTPIRTERMRPALLPIIQCVLQINLIRSVRMIKSLNARPDLIVEATPEVFAMAQETGLVQNVQMAEGMPNIISVGGKPTEWAIAQDVDLDKLETSWQAELDAYINEWKEPTDSDTLQGSTANAYLTAVEAIRRRMTPLLKARDWLKTQLVEMALHSVTVMDKEFRINAAQSIALSGSELAAGMPATIGPEDLSAFEYKVNVVTRAMTQSEQRAREELGMQRVAWGIGTKQEVIEVAYTDATEQDKNLAIDAGKRIIQPVVLNAVDVAWRDIVRLEAGVLIPPAGMPPALPGDPMAQVGAEPMVPAAVGAAEGGAY